MPRASRDLGIGAVRRGTCHGSLVVPRATALGVPLGCGGGGAWADARDCLFLDTAG